MRIVTDVIEGDDRVNTVLVRTPASETRDRDVRTGLLERAGQRDCRLLAITCEQSAPTFVERWRNRIGSLPLDLVLVDVGQMTRSSAAQASTSTAPQSPARGSPPLSATGHDGNAIRAVADPADLATTLGIIDETLEQWAEMDEDIVVYLDSLSPFLDRRTLVDVVEFLSTLSSLARVVGASAYVCLGSSVDPACSKALGSAVDVSIEFSGHGTIVERTESDASTDRLSVDTTFELLSDRRRRVALYHLLEVNRTTDVRTLATRVAHTECGSAETPTVTDEKRVYTDLTHRHLPVLEEAGIVTVDESSNRVTLLETVRALEPYLALAIPWEWGGTHAG